MPVDEELVAFCEAQRPRLVGFLGLYCGDAQVAEELAHDAIAKTCQRWRHVRGMDAPDAWVYRVALNLAASHFRRIAAERRARARFPNPRAPQEADRDDAIAVRKAVTSLPKQQRTALVLRYYLDLSVAETAQLMGCADGTVKSLTHKAIASLHNIRLLDN